MQKGQGCDSNSGLRNTDRSAKAWREGYLLALLVGVYALLEVAAELNTLSNSARAAYLSEDALE